MLLFGRITDTMMGSTSDRAVNEAVACAIGVEGQFCGDDRNTGEVSGDPFSVGCAVLRLGCRARGRGFGWFLPGRCFGLMPGDRSERPFHFGFDSCKMQLKII